MRIKRRAKPYRKNRLTNHNKHPAPDMTPLHPATLTRGAPQWLAKFEGTHPRNIDRIPNAPWPAFLAGQADKPVRVLLIDEDEGSRRAVVHELVSDPRVCVVGEAGSLQEARRMLSQQEFDVLILDVRLGGGKGFDLIGTAKAHCSRAEVIVHSTLADEAHVRRAFAAGASGASGYLVKNSWFQDFSQSVLQVVNGGAAVSPDVVRHLLVRWGAFAPARSCDDAAARKMLSAREREVLRIVDEGKVTQEIACLLSISGRTVCAHMKSILHKLQVRTRAHAVIAAVDQRLL